MSAKILDFPKTPHERARAVIQAAQNYAQALEAFEAADATLTQARHTRQRDTGQLADELDAAADQLGAAQQRVADLTLALTIDGSLQELSELLAAATAGRP
jgi:chromosome segregation ATPase